MKSLLLGCGKNLSKQVALKSQPDWVGKLVTLDINPDVLPTVEWDMEEHPLPFADEEFVEIGAFNSLEHIGRQGDWRGWFSECAEYHRVLKPGGRMFILVPIGQDALADPGHTRFFHSNYFGFLSQKFYERSEVAQTCFTDYRWYWKLNFEIEELFRVENHHLAVILRKEVL